jgi:DNA-binding response OmpR family regulator
MAEQIARILVVDRSGAETASLQQCVAGDDRIVAVADESRDLMATVAEFRPNLVILVAASDIVGSCRECRALKRDAPKLLVLATCSLGELGDIELLVDAGIDDFLSSPINAAELSKRVDNLLRLSWVI